MDRFSCLKGILNPFEKCQDLDRLVKFVVVGGLNFVVTGAVFVLTYKSVPLGALILESHNKIGAFVAGILGGLGIHEFNAAVASLAGYLAGMSISLIVNGRWTFNSRVLTFVQVVRFIGLNLFNMVGSVLLLFVFVDILSGPYLFVWLFSVVLTTISNYFGLRYWVFSS